MVAWSVDLVPNIAFNNSIQEILCNHKVVEAPSKAFCPAVEPVPKVRICAFGVGMEVAICINERWLIVQYSLEISTFFISEASCSIDVVYIKLLIASTSID